MELDIQCKMIKPLGKNTGNNLQDLRLHKKFLTFTPKAQSIKKMNISDLIKIKTVCSVKDPVKGRKRHASD